MVTRVTFLKGQTAKKVNIFENRFKIAANYHCASLPNGFFSFIRLIRAGRMKYVLQSFFSYRTTVFDRVQAWIAASAAGIFNSKTLININYQAVSQSLNDFEARLLAQHRFLVKICPYASLMMLCFSIGQKNILMATEII